ncbi:type II toxin-antitoxin system RelB/DinJ family antitoxin [Thermodesulfobacteriota bacterium]
MAYSISKSFKLFYRQVIAQRRLSSELHVPNENTMKEIERSGKWQGKKFFSKEGLFEDLDI